MKYIRLSIETGLATVQIDRQNKLNALNADLMEELDQTFEELYETREVKVIIITGSGDKAFVAGADIGQFPTLTPEEAEAFSLKGQHILSRIENCPKPVIAAINGFALGGGCELALACHLRYAADTAVFGQPEVKLGVIAGYGGTQRLPRLIGTGRALDLLLSGRMVKAGEAMSMGLVNGVFPAEDLISEVEKVARELMKQGPLAQSFTLKAVYEGQGKTLQEGLKLEADAFREVFRTEDHIEGSRAFLERRSPDFKNR